MGEAARTLDRLTLTEGERDVFRRRGDEAVSVWCERAIRVMDGPYAGGGWRNSVTPYLAGIMDAWNRWGVVGVVVCGSPQSGKTRALYNCLSFSVDQRPGPKMLAMPDDDALKKVSQHKLLPGLKASPVTRKKLVKTSMTVFEFADGSPLYLASAQSPSDRASVSVRDMFLDEEDLYRKFATQGDPVGEFLERLTSYRFKSRFFRVSKPIGGEESSIWQGLRECDLVMAYAARCPACGEYQIMRFSQVKFFGCRDPQEMRRKGLARYECEHCRYKWSDHARDVAVRRGKWIPAAMPDGPDGRWTPIEAAPSPKIIGFHLPALISPFVSLSDIAADFLAARIDPAKWAGFFNGRLAEPYRPKKIQTSVERVLELRDIHLPPRVVPAAAVALTAGIDTQKRGFWFVVRAWTASLSSWLVDYGFLLTFEDVYKQILETRYPQEETGEDMWVWRAGIDSGGGETVSDVWTRTEEVYQFVRNVGGGRLFATKGASHSQLAPVRISQLDKMPKSGVRILGGLNLFILDTDYFKRLIHARMGADHTQPFRLHAETGAGGVGTVIMKCLSVRQPWPWAMFNLGKDVENRSWPTKYRGPVAIHASKWFQVRPVRDTLLFLYASAGRFEPLDKIARVLSEMRVKTGGIVGVATIVDCVRRYDSPWAEPGQWHWVLEDRRPLPFQPLKGRLGLFDAEVRL